MITCPVCGSTKFTKESNYLICEYCGSNRITDKPEEKKDSGNRMFVLLFGMIAMAAAVILMTKGEKPVLQEVSSNKQIQAKKVVHSRFPVEPKIEITNAKSTIDTQAIQVTDELQHLKVTNQDSTIQTQVIQTKNMTKVRNRSSRDIELSDMEYQEDFLNNSNVVEHIGKSTDENGNVHTTVYTKHPQVQFHNGYLKVQNGDIQIKKQNVSFFIDAQGRRHYEVGTEMDLK